LILKYGLLSFLSGSNPYQLLNRDYSKIEKGINKLLLSSSDVKKEVP